MATLGQSRFQLSSMRSSAISLLIMALCFVGFSLVISSEIWTDESAPAAFRIGVTLMTALAVIASAAFAGRVWRAHRALRALANGTVEHAPGSVHWSGRAYRAEANGVRLELLRGQELSPGPYDMQYLADSHYLVGATPLGAPQAEQVVELVDALGSVFGFDSADLESCRLGMLSPALRARVLRRTIKSAAALGLIALIMFGFSALIVVRGQMAKGNVLVVGLVGLVVAGVAVMMIYLAARGVLTARQGNVDVLDGTVTESVRRSGRSTSYYLVVAGRSIQVSPTALAVMVTPQRYRIYVLRGTSDIVAIEPVI